MNGLLVLDKSAGMTSHDVVARVPAFAHIRVDEIRRVEPATGELGLDGLRQREVHVVSAKQDVVADVAERSRREQPVHPVPLLRPPGQQDERRPGAQRWYSSIWSEVMD